MELDAETMGGAPFHTNAEEPDTVAGLIDGGTLDGLGEACLPNADGDETVILCGDFPLLGARASEKQDGESVVLCIDFEPPHGGAPNIRGDVA